MEARAPISKYLYFAAMKKLFALALLVVLGAAQANDPMQRVRQFRQAHEQELLTEFEQLVAIPNAAADTANLRRTALFVQGMMQRRGISARLLAAATPGVPPAVFGEVRTPGATRTIIFYAHYDGQPVNPAQWREGLQPFRPVLATGPLDRGGQLTIRPAADQPLNPDWRLFFAQGDWMQDLSLQEVIAVGKRYLLRDNRTLAWYLPTEEAMRAPEPARVLVAEPA